MTHNIAADGIARGARRCVSLRLLLGEEIREGLFTTVEGQLDAVALARLGDVAGDMVTETVASGSIIRAVVERVAHRRPVWTSSLRRRVQ